MIDEVCDAEPVEGYREELSIDDALSKFIGDDALNVGRVDDTRNLARVVKYICDGINDSLFEKADVPDMMDKVKRILNNLLRDL